VRHPAPSPAPFGQVAGRTARLFTLQNDVIRAQVTDYGGVLVRVETHGKAGRVGDVVLGFDDVAIYATTPGFFGAILGRNANRIAGARITVDGHTYNLSKNDKEATLHGGAVGFAKQFWSVTTLDPERIRLHLTSVDGDQGFPGRVEAYATYELAGPALRLIFDARTTKPTPLTLSAHPYFNLDGPDAPHCFDHRVQILASHYLPTDKQQIPTGEIRAVANTPFDFTVPRRIGARIRENHEQLRYGRGYDHYFVLTEGGPEPRLAARIHAAESGRILEILTTQRGVQFYTGNNLDGSARGRSGLYRQSAGFAFEPQGFPNAPNQPNFPSTILQPGEPYHEEIVYRFCTENDGALP
jgi:aldose 1-epimerase